MQNEDKQRLNVWGLAWSLGYQIAVPLVVFALIGRYIDKSYDTSPWFLLIGVILAIIISTSVIYIRIKGLLENSTEDIKKNNYYKEQDNKE